MSHIAASCHVFSLLGFLCYRCGSSDVSKAVLNLPRYPCALRTTAGAGETAAPPTWLEKALAPLETVLFLDTDGVVPGRRYLEERRLLLPNGSGNLGNILDEDGDCAAELKSSEATDYAATSPGGIQNEVEVRFSLFSSLSFICV